MLPLTVTHNQKPSLVAEAKHEEAIFRFGVFFIEELERELVIEDRPSLFERNTMLLLI